MHGYGFANPEGIAVHQNRTDTGVAFNRSPNKYTPLRTTHRVFATSQ
jgi:hypothetical protein